jgi:hypothetical protein
MKQGPFVEFVLSHPFPQKTRERMGHPGFVVGEGKTIKSYKKHLL